MGRCPEDSCHRSPQLSHYSEPVTPWERRGPQPSAGARSPQPQLPCALGEGRPGRAAPHSSSARAPCGDSAGPVPTPAGPAPGHAGAHAPRQFSREQGLAKMAALCESFTLRGPGPGGGGPGPGPGLCLEPGPGSDLVLLTERGRAATLFKVPRARARGPAAPPRQPRHGGCPVQGWGRAVSRISSLPAVRARPRCPGRHPCCLFPLLDWLPPGNGAGPARPCSAPCGPSGLPLVGNAERLERLFVYFSFC